MLAGGNGRNPWGAAKQPNGTVTIEINKENGEIRPYLIQTRADPEAKKENEMVYTTKQVEQALTNMGRVMVNAEAQEKEDIFQLVEGLHENSLAYIGEHLATMPESKAEFLKMGFKPRKLSKKDYRYHCAVSDMTKLFLVRYK